MTQKEKKFAIKKSFKLGLWKQTKKDSLDDIKNKLQWKMFDLKKPGATKNDIIDEMFTYWKTKNGFLTTDDEKDTSAENNDNLDDDIDLDNENSSNDENKHDYSS